MFWRDNKGKNKTDNKAEERPAVTCETMSREEFLGENEDAKKVYQEIMDLRKSLENLKHKEEPVNEIPVKEVIQDETENMYLEENEEVIAAKQAIIDRARQDAEKARLEREELRQKELAFKEEQRKIIEAQKRAAKVAEEAERKRLEAIEAEKKAKELSRKKAFEDMESEMLAKKAELSHTATEQEMAEFFEEKSTDTSDDSLEKAKNELLEAQKHQGKMLDKISTLTEKNTEKLAEEQQKKLTQQQVLLQVEQKRLEDLLRYQQTVRLEKEQNAKAEKEIREQKAKIDKIIKDEKARKKKEEKERVKREKREALEQEKLEEAKRKAAAELGGGVVNVHNMQINTKIKSVAHFSLKDLLGITSRQEKKAATEDERQALKDEREQRREEARALADMMAKKRWENYENSPLGKKSRAFKNFCDEHKAMLLTAFAIVMIAIVGTAGIFNYCTAYEYSYNGKTLGLVKYKSDVLEITDLVQGALTKDKDIDVIIDARDDISFKRVPALGNKQIDSTEEVLKRLTYMGDLNVKAYGIYVNGKKVGAVQNKDIAAQVLQDIKAKYSTGMKNSEIEEAVFIEKVQIKQSNTDLQDISSENEMVDKLCTSGKKESLHKVVAGETLADIAKLYSLSEDDILKNNSNINPKKLDVGSTLVIKQNAPVITAKITELVTYQEKIKHKVEKKKTKSLYKGDTKLKQKGKDGLSEITARVVSVNGERIDETNLVTTIKREPVTKVILVGSKKRPPTVGSGKYIWPLAGGYTVTSEFGARWGRLHAGIDLGCPVGSDVRAADGGTVIQAGYSGSYGNLVVIDHQNGMQTYYAHNSQLLVSVGDKVYQGQHIAESGNTGRSTGPHVHFEIHNGGSAVNPRNYLP